MCLVAEHLMCNGINSHFPNTNPETDTDSGFTIQLKNYGSSKYIIYDDDLDMKLEIENILLENPKFNLIGWYVKYLNETGILHQQYQKYHELCYAPIPYGEIDKLENLPGLVAWPNEECNTIEFENN